MIEATAPALEIELPFADGVYLFRLNLPQIDELERRCGTPVRHPTYGEMVMPAGVGAIAGRLMKGRYKVRDLGPYGELLEADFHSRDVMEVIRLALIGGGRGQVAGEDVTVSPIRAGELMVTYAHRMSWAARWDLAVAIISVCMNGFVRTGEDPPSPKKAEPAEMTGSSTSPAP